MSASVGFPDLDPQPCHLDKLPPELLPSLLAPLAYRVADLAAVCRVSRLLRHLATPLLYEKLWLRDHARLRKFMATVAQKPHLAHHVRILELRVYPFGLRAEQLESLEHGIEVLLRNATRLEELYWTRTGSLNDRILPHLATLPSLRTLEINGDSRGWSPWLLVQSLPSGVRRLSLLLPDRNVCSRLVDVARALPQLQSLNILSQHTNFLTDAHLVAMAAHLRHLTSLSLAGCRAVRGAGLHRSLEVVGQRLLHLGLEGCSIDARDLKRVAELAPRLRSLVVTPPPKSSVAAAHGATASTQPRQRRQQLQPQAQGSRTAPTTTWADTGDDDGPLDASVLFQRSLARLVSRLPRLCELTLYESSWSRSNDDQGIALGGDDEDADDGGAEGVGDGRGHSLRSSDGHGAGAGEEGAMDDDVDGHERVTTTTTTTRGALVMKGHKLDDVLVRALCDRHSLAPLSGVRGGGDDGGGGGGPAEAFDGAPDVTTPSVAEIRKLRIHGIGMSTRQLAAVCEACPEIEELVVHLYEPRTAEQLSTPLRHLKRLETLHVLASSLSPLELAERDVAALASRCAPTLRVVGFRNRVWEVHRVPIIAETGQRTSSDLDRDAGEAGQGETQWIEAAATSRERRGAPSPPTPPPPLSPPTRSSPLHPSSPVSPRPPVRRDDGVEYDVVLRRWDWRTTGAFPEALLVVRA